MNLTYEEKELYVAFIQTVYQGAIPVTANDISPEVVEIADKMLNAIVQCSRQMAVTHAVYSVFYGKVPISIGQILKLLGKAAAQSVKSWIKTGLSDRRYKSCISSVALNWRSPLQMALMGI